MHVCLRTSICTAPGVATQRFSLTSNCRGGCVGSSRAPDGIQRCVREILGRWPTGHIDGVRLRIQLLDSEGDHHDYARWPVEETAVQLRYRDLPNSVLLLAPTLATFAAMKTAAWVDRHAARDLYDLAALARAGALTGEAADLVKAATGVSVTRDLFTSVAVANWTEQLAHQTQVLPAAGECLDQVKDAYASALDWPPPYDPFE